MGYENAIQFCNYFYRSGTKPKLVAKILAIFGILFVIYVMF